MFVVHVDKGEEVLDKVRRVCLGRGVFDAAIVSLIGAVAGARISVMAKDDAEVDLAVTYEEPLEITGTGEIVEGQPHIHVVAGGERGTFAGHLHAATVDTFFVRAYVEPVEPGGHALR